MGDTITVATGTIGDAQSLVATVGLVLSEYGERYAYVGKGPDKLYLDPQPDAMADQSLVITYTGPKGGCTVTEVTRGSTEAKECSGRGNCTTRRARACVMRVTRSSPAPSKPCLYKRSAKISC